MNEERYVAAIEISSSKIICAVGRYNGSGQLSVEAVEQEECKDIVRYGIVQNLEETALKVNRILDKLQRRPNIQPKKITSLFVGLSGRSLRSIATEVRITLPEETEITDEILQRLKHDALQTAIDNTLEVVDAVPRVYNVGKSETLSPKGMLGRDISVTYDIIVCRPDIKRNLKRALEDKTSLKIEGFIVTPLAAGHIVLSSEDKRLGCMLVDMGAETTTVTIYTNGCLRYFATLPLGGRNITRDLCSLSLLEERAEEIKQTSGNAIARETASHVNLNGIKYSEVSNIIVARSEEIVANIVEQVAYAGLTSKDLPGGIICIGGASRLNGISDLLARQSGMNVRIGHLPDYVHLQSISIPRTEMVEVGCILYEGATLSDAVCLSTPMHEDLPRLGEVEDTDEEPQNETNTNEKRNGRFSKILNRLNNGLIGLFAPPEDDESDLLD